MLCQAGFDQWQRTIMHHVSPLRQPQATVLALWSLAMGRARSWALSAVSPWLATGRQRKEQPVRQPLRDWSYEAQRQRGATRQALRGEPGFPLLLGGVGSWGQGTPLARALDATAWGDRLVVWAGSVVSRGGASPVAWVGLPAHTKHAGRRAGRRLLRRLRPALPRPWQGIVLAARGG